MDNKQYMLLLALASCFLLNYGAADKFEDDEKYDTFKYMQGSTERNAPAPKCPTFRSQYDFSSEDLNLRPIIGILADAPTSSMRRALDRKGWQKITSYLAASYVKSFESAGARVVPIMINKSPKYYEMMAKNLNGIVFPGGDSSKGGYYDAAAQLYRHVMKANDNGTVLPLFSVNLGFKVLMKLASGVESDRSIVDRCNFQNLRNNLIFVQGAEKSKMFGHMSDRLMAALQSERITSNFNSWCVSEYMFNSLRINDSFNILSTSLDKDGLEYITTVEHKEYPVFGIQWHAEKPAYEWRDGLDGIPRAKEALQVNEKLMEMFLDHVRQNKNSFPDGAEEDHLIYKFSPFPVQQLYRSSFLQVYFFDESDWIIFHYR